MSTVVHCAEGISTDIGYVGDAHIRFAEPVPISKPSPGVMPATTLRNVP
jgi:hypothetical protein